MSDEEYAFSINFEEPWKNPEGILVIEGNRSILNSREVVDRINFYVRIEDLRDYESGRFRASLGEDGKSITLIKPSLACYQWKKATTIQNAEVGFSEGVDVKILEQHKIICAMIANDPKVVERSVTLVLDDGRTMNNKHFNANAVGLELEPRLRRRGVAFSDKKGNSVDAVHYFAYFSVAVSGTLISTEKKVGDTEVEQVGRLLQGLLDFEDEED